MSLASLHAINVRLLAQAEPSPTETDSATATWNAGQTEGAAPPDAGEDEFKGFSATDKFEFERVINWIIDSVYGGSATGKSTFIDAFVNDWAVKWRTDQSLTPVDKPNLTPTLEDLLNIDDFVNGAIWMPLTMTDRLPPVFESTSIAEDGTETPAIATSDPMKGVQFITTPEELKKVPSKDLFSVVRSAGSDLIRRVMTGGTGGVGTQDETAQAAVTTPTINASTGFTTGTQSKLNLPDYMKTAILYSDPAAEGRQPIRPLPVITQPDLIQTLIDTTSSGGGGGGGGGGGRQFVADEDQLRAQADQMWRTWLREPSNDGKINAIVSDYVSQASSFWRDKGGQLDFGTFLENKLKAEPRYQLLYRNKPPEMSELQYQATFSNPISSVGLRPELASQETTQAIVSGGSPTSQLSRISRTREAELQPGFSQRLAQTLAGLGA